MRRGSEWTPRAQSRALALGSFESGKCPGCGNYETLVPLPKSELLVTWDEHGGRKVTVRQFRCVTCASASIVQRDFAERYKDHKPVAGHASPSDGRMFAAIPAREEADE